MNQKVVGALLAIVGAVLVGLAIATAHQDCPASNYNGTGPPPSPPPCTGHYSWSALPLLGLAIGVFLLSSSGVVALYPRT